MTQNEKLALMKDRYNKKAQMPKNLKCPGAMKKLRRQIRKMEQ
jgi:hypothetical protein